MRTLHQFSFADGASAAVEFAIILPAILLFVAGLIDYGNVMTISTRVNSSLRAATQYAMAYPKDSSGITAAGTSATNDTRLSVGAPTLFCTCGPWGLATSTAPAACPVDCSAATVKTQNFYVSVTATESYTPLLPFKGLGAALTVSNTATIQVE